MTQQTIKCRICRGERPTNGRVCLGCGTHIENARDVSRPKKAIICSRPNCRSTGPHKLLEPGRYNCQKCNAVFEPADFSHLHTDPHRNVELKEGERARDGRRGRR